MVEILRFAQDDNSGTNPKIPSNVTHASTLVQLQRPTIATDQTRRKSTRTINLSIDGQAVSVSEGTTIYNACRSIGVEIPTLCFLDTLHPVNVCRVCVVEVEGARVLVPSCSRAVEDNMVVRTASDRVKHSRKLVLELLASSVDLETTPHVAEWIGEYDADPARFGPAAPPAPSGTRDAAVPGHHAPPDAAY